MRWRWVVGCPEKRVAHRDRGRPLSLILSSYGSVRERASSSRWAATEHRAALERQQCPHIRHFGTATPAFSRCGGAKVIQPRCREETNVQAHGVSSQRGVEAVETPQPCCFPGLQASMTWFLCQEWVILRLVTDSAQMEVESWEVDMDV
jgi:hypothetical protein